MDIVIYFVNDLERARRFYHETLELPILEEYPDFLIMGIGGVRLGLHPSETGGADVGRGPLLYMETDDMDAALETLRLKNVKTRGPSAVPTGRIAHFWDSEGNALGLFQPSGKNP